MRPFGELEADIMDKLWAWDEPASVREVLEELNTRRDLAYTTVMTVMDTLHKKGWLTRERDGRAFRYRPSAPREEYASQLIAQALDGGDRVAALVHFFDTMTPAEAAQLRKALSARARPKGGRA